MNYARGGQRESHRENFSLSFEVQRATGRVVCACGQGLGKRKHSKVKKIEKAQKYGHLGDYK